MNSSKCNIKCAAIINDRKLNFVFTKKTDKYIKINPVPRIPKSA